MIDRIQKDLFDFIENDPDDFDGLIEFWFQNNTNALSAALTNDPGNKILVNIDNFNNYELLAKRLFLIADILVLRDNRKWT